MPFCTECGAENPRENKFCSECGSRLPDLTAPEPPAIFTPAEEPEPAVYMAPEPPAYTQPAQPAQPQQPEAYTPPQASSSAPQASAAPQYVAPVATGGLVAWSIVTLLLCTIPGIVALVQTLGINKCTTVEEQEKKRKNAQIWCIVGTVLGVLAIIGRVASGS